MSVPPRVGQARARRDSPARAPGDLDRRAADRAQRQRRRDRAVLLARARLRRPREARPRRARRRARDLRAGANDDGTPRVRHGQRLERRGRRGRRAPRPCSPRRGRACAAPTCSSLLIGNRALAPGASVTAPGRGPRSTSARRGRGELTADPATLAFGRAEGDGWHATQHARRSATSRRGTLLVRVRSAGAGRARRSSSTPQWVRLKPGGHATGQPARAPARRAARGRLGRGRGSARRARRRPAEDPVGDHLRPARPTT